jgi:hypothetical protein
MIYLHIDMSEEPATVDEFANGIEFNKCLCALRALKHSYPHIHTEKHEAMLLTDDGKGRSRVPPFMFVISQDRPIERGDLVKAVNAALRWLAPPQRVQ